MTRGIVGLANADSLTGETWSGLTQNMAQSNTEIWGVVEHKEKAWQSLDTRRYVPLFNECGITARGDERGGVGWCIRKDVADSHAYEEWHGPAEGEFVKWIRKRQPGGFLYYAVFYMPHAESGGLTKAERDKVKREIQAAIVSMKGKAFTMAGDLNIDIRGENDSEAAEWRAVLEAAGAEVINHEGEWGTHPTRVPRGRQGGQNARSSSIDVVIASRQVRERNWPSMKAWHSGAGWIDGAEESSRLETIQSDGFGTLTDHKVLRWELRAATVTPRNEEEPIYRRWHHVKKQREDPKTKDRYAADLTARNRLHLNPEVNIPPTQMQADLVAELECMAEKHFGSSLSTKRPKECRLHSAAANKAYRKLNSSHSKKKKQLVTHGADSAIYKNAVQRWTAARKAYRVVSRAEATEKYDRNLAFAKEQGSRAVEQFYAKESRRLMGGRGGRSGPPAGAATLQYPAGAPVREATGAKEVGNLVSAMTQEVSAANDNDPAFDNEFKSRQEQAWAEAKAEPDFMCPATMQQEPTMADVQEAVDSLRSKLSKEPGPDGITNWMLCWGGPTVVQALHALYVKVWREQQLPEQWSTARISYIYKGKGPKMEVSGYRPISLISVIGKTFTRSWLPRLVAQVSAGLARAQGCGRPGQGCQEQLWAFQTIMEECIEGGDGDGEEGAFALFADVHKAYDQVWRSGLFLSLYGLGVRGSMLGMIEKWLGSSKATTSWCGVQGPEVHLAQGLRQGCVLSPILYCAFINLLLAEGPRVEVPEGMRSPMRELYSQGLQEGNPEVSSEWGVKNMALVERVRALLYMDDTTIIAKSEEDLGQMTLVYLEFCRKMRMRVNIKKTQVMRFGKDEEEPWALKAGDVSFASPKNGMCRFLGLHMDHRLKGHELVRDREARLMRWKVRLVTRKLGEVRALDYLATTLAPQVLYASELADGSIRGKLRKRWGNLIQEVVLGGGLDDHNTYWSKQPRLNKGCLLAETRELPWDRQVEMRQMRLYCTLLKAGPESLAGSMMRGLKGNPRALKKNKCIARAVKTAKAWGVRPRPLASKNEVQVWKKGLRLRARRAGRKELEAAQVELDVKVRGDTMLLGSLSKGWGETGNRAVLFPHPETRVYLCRLLYGHARGLREPIIKYARSSNKLTQTRRMYLEHCPCQRGNQTASHMWQTCAETQ